MNVKYRIHLTEEERTSLEQETRGGVARVRRTKRAQILLAADSGHSDEEIAALVGAGTATVYRIKRRCVEGGVSHALTEDERPGGARKLSGEEEAHLIALACTKPPPGRAKWTCQLLANRVVALTVHTSLSGETVRRRLKENELKPWQRKMWCIPKVDAEFVARMEDILDLYAETPEQDHPVICFDEAPIQLVGETREPIPARPGRKEKFDYEYVRNGCVNAFTFLDAHVPWRHVKISDRRCKTDFAQCMKDLVDVHYPTAVRIRVVLDNLSTHSAAALYETFPPKEARRILSRLEFHYTPKHASWLNMVEIEIGVLRQQCLDRRIDNTELLESGNGDLVRGPKRARRQNQMDV